MGLLEKYGNRYGFNTQQYAQPQQVANLEQTEQILQQLAREQEALRQSQQQESEFSQPQPQANFNAPPAPIAPQAPSADNLNQGKSQGRGLFDLERLKKEAQGFIQNVKSGGDAFRSKDDLIKTEIARIRNDGGLLQTLTRGDEKTAEITKQNKANIENIAKKHGYDLGVEIDDDGKVYFGKSGENGEPIIKEVTPSFLNDMGAYRNEILGALALTALTGGQNIPLLFATSATGSALGAGADFHNRDELTQENETAKDYLSRMGGAVADDLVGGAIVSGIAKGGKALINHAPSVKNALNNTAELGGKVWDNSGVSAVLRHATTDNISGAETALNKAVQGEANALQGLVETRNALGESAYNKFVNETPLNIPKTKNETINKGIDFLNEKIVEPISQTTKKIISDSDLNQREANLFLSALGNKQNGAKIIKDSIANDPNAFEKAGKIFSKLNTTARENLIKELGESKTVTDIFKEYEKSVKNDYAQVVDTLSEIFKEPISTAKTQEIKRNILLSLQDSGYPLNSQYRTLVNETLQKPTDFKAWNELRNYTNAEIGKLTKNGVNDAISFDRVEALSAIKNKIDEAMEEIYEAEIKSPKFANASKELMEQARADYKVFKELETSELYRQISHGIKNENKMIETLLKANGNQNGVGLSEFLDILGVKSRAEMENAIIKSVIEKNTIDGVTNFKAINETLANLPIQTGRASSLKEYINTNSSILNNSSDILEFLNKSTPKTVELQQGIGSKIWGAIKVMFRNRVVNKLKSRLPIYGNNQALHNHIANAIKNSGDLETAIKNIEQMPTENLPSETAKALEAFKKDFANIKDEIRAEAKQDIKQMLKEMSDKGEIDILEMAKNIKPKQQADQVAENLAQAEAKQTENVGKFGDEADILAMARERNANAVKEPIKGNGFTMSKDGKITFLDEAKFELNQELQNKTGLQDKITTSLAWLQDKHPEMFANKRAVKEVIDYVLNEPQIIKPAKSENSVFMGKMDNEKIKDIVVNKDENKIIHATHRKPSKAEKADSGDALPPHSDTMSDGALKLADKQRLSAFNDDIISQNAKHSDFLNKKTDLGVIKEVYELPNGELQFLINGEWIHERTASFTNLKAIRELIRKPNLDKFDIWRLKSVKRNFDLNRGDKSSQIAKEIDLYNDEFAYKTRRKGEQLDNAQRLYQGIETRLDEVKKQTENLPPKPKTGAELKAEFDDLAEKYDIEQFLKDRENISANDIRYTRTAVNGSSSRTSRKNADGTYTYSKPEMEHNYKADFAFTKSDVAKLRKQIQSGEFDENLLNKLKNDLDGAEPQGYTNYLKSADDIAESKAEKEFKQTGKEPEIKELKDGRIWDNKHGKYIYMFSNESLGGGLLGGSVSGIQTDENGNITGFDPAKFAVGFGAGFGAMKLGANAGIKDKANAVKANLKAKQMQEKGKKFAEFCNRALKTDNKAVFDFGELSEKQVNSLRKIKNDLGQIREFNFSGYTLKIDSATIRHIKNNHPDDLKYLTNLGDIYENSTSARWALNRNEKGQSELSITLYKKYSNGELGAVEIVDTGDKTLNLKTFYKVDKE
ncbi:PBECR3 domain-containing polyvalent protein [Campylobacter sp. CN_NA1]|uniref:PBECR3 domain-containing polyvalent protein n=1 Tax=Campylobacter sp. CN_NA1 TaxID=2984150 RepID=UPI0022E9E428|nr:hypothetical protein [Campylobacter sp. CN_NA1]MDA3056429.1 hypothetical protein [Campylobacter sp. CN_NA1]